MKYVAYYRVSTSRQDRSGLGLEAQKEAVRQFLESKGWPPIAEYTEVESGRSSTRPQLQAALAYCRLMGATLVVAKLDRLARNAAFLMNLRDAGVEFVCCDMPDANRMTVGILACVAEDEADRISRRTKEALAAAKARGVKLGGDRGYRPPLEASLAAARAHRDKARSRAEDFRGVLAEISGGLQAKADEMNRRGIPTPSGRGEWHPATVARVLKKLEGAA